MWKLESVGVLYVGELILFLVAAWAFSVNIANARFWERGLVLPLGCLALTFFGYILADLINATGSNNILRGWARLVFLGTNILAVHFLCRGKRVNLLLFCLGVSAGTAISPAGGDLYFHYKLGLALPITVGVLCFSALRPNRTGFLLTSIGLVAAGVLHILMDFRSLGGICILCGFVVFWKTAWRSRVPGLHALVAIAAVAVGVFALSGYYDSAQRRYTPRRQESDSWRIAAANATVHAIREAPLFGNGSWATSSQVATMFDASFAETLGHRRDFRPSLDLPGHSQFLQAWYEAGILGLAFFLYFAYSLSRALWICIFRVPLDPLIPLAILYCTLSLYNIGFSPFAGGHRIHMAISVAIVAMVSRSWNSTHEAQYRNHLV